MILNSHIIGLIISIILLFNGCAIISPAVDTTKVIGKTAWSTSKITFKTTKALGKIAWKAIQIPVNAIRTGIYLAKGKQIIPLTKKGNSLYADVKLNRKVRASFLIDTGASNVHISRSMAKRLGLKLNKGEPVLATIAGGHVVSGRAVYLKEIRLGRVKIRKVRAIVFDTDNLGMRDGLLGMSFLNHFIFQINTKKPELILQRRIQ